MRRRFPYKFKTIEYYDPSEKNNYWKKMIQVDDHYRKIWFYHHRNKDCLIYREEQIGKKTFEKFKNREDKLIYRSVTFDNDIQTGNEYHPNMTDKVYGRTYYIKKMAQKFELDPYKSASDQIRKTEFNIANNQVLIHYHYEEGQIFKKPDKINRMEIQGKMGEMGNEKDDGGNNDQNKKQQYYAKINDMEQKCNTSILSSETNAHEERTSR